MPELATVWSKFIADQNGEIKNWKIPEITAQHDFYRKQVAPILEKHSTAKVYVIVSDAFRYEAATELVAELNHKAGERKVWETEMNVQLGVLPSYTKLGMASLLPHNELTFSADASDVLVDGISSQGIENRRRILAQVNGAAIHLKDLRQMKTEQGREFVRPHRVVYIYHDEIDETGDTAASEHP